MKNIFKSLMLVAVAAMGFTACNNENIEEVTNDSLAERTYTMTFTAEAPESRTSVAINGDVATYSWCEDDVVGFIQNAIGTDVNKCNKKKSQSIAIEGTKATFTTSFDDVADATTFNYGAFYPEASWVNTTNFNEVTVKINAAQTLTAGTFDHDADLMISKPILNVETKDGHGGVLQFSRIAAIGKMNLKLTDMAEGEIIESVKFTLAEGTHFNGPVTLDMENSTYELGTTDTSNAVTLTGELAADADRTAIFFTCFPGEYSGAYTIEVVTDKATYSKTGELANALTFTAGDVLNFNATVGNRVVSNVEAYTKITNANLADYSGTYLIVYEAGSVVFNGSLETLDAAENNKTVEITDDTITGAYSAYTFTIEKVDGGYSIKSASGIYIGQTTNGNGMASNKTTAYTNTISINGGNADIISSGAYLRFNNSTNSGMRFRYYKSSSYTNQKAIALYRQNGTGSDEEIQYVDLATPTNLEATAKGNVVTVTWDAVENATNYDVTVVNGATTNVKTNSAGLTLDYDTTYTISVVAKGGVGFNDSAAATVKVTTGEQPATGDDTELGASWSYTWTANENKITKNGTTTINGLDWSLITTASNYAWDSNNRGWQVGTAAGDVILKTSSYVGAVNKIELILSTNGSGNTASVSVGGTAFGAAQTISSGTSNANKTYTFTSETPCSGEIVITLNDKAKSVYFKGISINPAN